MKRSMRNLIVITFATSLVALLSLGLSGCKKHQSAQDAGDATAAQSTNQNQVGHAGSWSAKDAQVAVGQPANTTGSSGAPNAVGSTSAGAESVSNHNSPSNNAPTNGAGAPSTMTTAPAIAEAPKEVPVTCFVETFKHKATAGHDSEEACSHHKNLVSLSHKVINPKSVCVRVNDVPVRFQPVTGGELLIGSVAGPKATITVSYCTGKNTCEFTKKSDCAVPKDEFLDAIGGSDTDEGAVAQWENTGNNEADAKLNNDVKRELADIDDAAPEHAGQAAVFKDWMNEKTSPSCGQATAKK